MGVGPVANGRGRHGHNLSHRCGVALDAADRSLIWATKLSDPPNGTRKRVHVTATPAMASTISKTQEVITRLGLPFPDANADQRHATIVAAATARTA